MYSVYPPARWIILTMTALINVVIVLIILKQEIKKRVEPAAKFTTTSLKYTSFTCIVSGFIANVSFLLLYLDGFCIFASYIGSVFLGLQGISMGLYQLSRLYYCFSNSQIHSDKGYPRWVFIIMVIFGVLLTLSGLIAALFNDSFGFNAKCGINSNLEYYSKSIHLSFIKYSIIWSAITWLLYTVWDIMTLLLYIAKVRLFKKFQKSEPLVYQRILSILYKIAIITLFYDITTFTSIFVFYILWILNSESIWIGMMASFVTRSFTVLYSYSMFIMMDYNLKHYVKFLKFIYRFKLHFCCCCYGYMIIDELQKLDNQTSIVSNDTEIKKRKQTFETTQFATLDAHDQNIQAIDCVSELTIQGNEQNVTGL